MDPDAQPEVEEILEEAYERFLEACSALEDEEEQGELNNPVMKRKFAKVDKCFKELVLYVNETVHGVWRSASPPPSTSKLQ